MPKWIQRWQVESSTGDKTYTVSQAEDGTFGCSCPVWKFRRQTCKHIVAIHHQMYGPQVRQARSEARIVDRSKVVWPEKEPPKSLDNEGFHPVPDKQVVRKLRLED